MTSLKDNNLGVFFTAQIHLESKVKCNLYLKSEDIYTNKQANMSSVEFLNRLILIKKNNNNNNDTHNTPCIHIKTITDIHK